MHGKTILIVDDDPDLVSLLGRAFSKAGAEVCTAANGQVALRLLHAHRPDLVILDVVMPVLDGWQTLRRIRDFADVPVILLTVRRKEDEIVQGFRAGATDYLTKPFSVKVLVARAEAILRRAAPAPIEEKPAPYDDGYLRIDLKGHQVEVQGEPVKLTPREYSLLGYLLQNAHRPLPPKEILEAVWGEQYVDSPRYVSSYIWRLRQKLEPDPGCPRYLVTRRGLGYRFEPQVPGRQSQPNQASDADSRVQGWDQAAAQ
jgi:two-component system KDP operon response regulator KdpE